MTGKEQADTAKELMDVTDGIIAYEQGDLDEEETLALFQVLVDSDLAWALQGSYGRTAVAYINAGLITQEGDTP